MFKAIHFMDKCLCHFISAEFQEWPEEDYPPYANGPGYIVSSDIAQYIVTEFEQHKLRVSDWSTYACLI